MYKKGFWVSLESAHPFPDDLYNKSDFEEALQEHVDGINEVFPDTKKVWVAVE